METQLTQEIKTQLRDFRPAFNSSMRTIRWAEEVQTTTGFVDVIRFEDYVTRDNSYCARFTPTQEDRESPLFAPETPVACKIEGKTFPCENCAGCFFKRTRYELGILTTCYEVKISVADFKSENGHNFHGNRNYYAIPIEIYERVRDLAPPGVGIIAYYPDSGHMTVKRKSPHQEISADALSSLLYDALKKWVDGKQETKRRK